MFHNATVKPFNRELDTETLGTLRSDDEKATRTSETTKGVVGKTTTLHMHLAFLYISLPFLHNYDETLPNFTF